MVRGTEVHLVTVHFGESRRRIELQPIEFGHPLHLPKGVVPSTFNQLCGCFRVSSLSADF